MIFQTDGARSPEIPSLIPSIAVELMTIPECEPVWWGRGLEQVPESICCACSQVLFMRVPWLSRRGAEVETGMEGLSPTSLCWEPLLVAMNFALVHLVL